ncbi:60S acidic ribosomal protein P1-alpha 3 [Mactra antiquata]
MMVDHQTSRINASVLSSFQGKKVCLLGTAKEVDSNGSSFTLTTCDGKDVQVNMQDPLNEYVSGLTEVHGIVDERNNIRCENYVTFTEAVTQSFNMDLYNSAVELTLRCPQYYQQGLQSPQ